VGQLIDFEIRSTSIDRSCSSVRGKIGNLSGNDLAFNGKLQEAADAAKDVASGAADHLQHQVHEQQRSGADFVERFAGNIRDAARAFERDAPFAARGINSAAEYVEDAAEKIRNGSFRDLVDGATDFAKRQPAAFLGISVLAGFAAIRFLKASGGHPSSPQSNNWKQASTSHHGNKS
jgi:methyl-accepting chemotaxis protein